MTKISDMLNKALGCTRGASPIRSSNYLRNYANNNKV